MALPELLTVDDLAENPNYVAEILGDLRLSNGHKLSNRALGRLLGQEDRRIRVWRRGKTVPDRLVRQLLWLIYAEYRDPIHGGRAFADRLDTLARREKESAALDLLRRGIECLRLSEPPAPKCFATLPAITQGSVLGQVMPGGWLFGLVTAARRRRAEVQAVMRALGDTFFDELEARVRARGIVPMLGSADTSRGEK